MSDTWNPGDRFQLAALGDRYDGTTGRIRRLWTGGDGREHAHVTHDDGTYTTWPTSRLEKPTDPSTGVVTAPTPAPPDDATPSLVELDPRESAAEMQSSRDHLVARALKWEAARGMSVAVFSAAADELADAVKAYLAAVSR